MKVDMIVTGYMLGVFLVYYLLCLIFNADEDDALHFAILALIWPGSVSFAIVVAVLMGPFYLLYKAAHATARQLDKRK